jgi:hypothetical protein
MAFLKNSRGSVYCACLALMLTGCLAPQYHEPTQNNLAKVRFVTINTINNPVFVYKYDSESCLSDATRVAILDSIGRGNYRKRMGLPLGEEFGDLMLTEVAVAAGQPLTFAMGHWAFNTHCSVNVTFDPEASKIYEFVHHVNNKKCMVNVSQIVTGPGNRYERVLEKTARVSTNQCMPGMWR